MLTYTSWVEEKIRIAQAVASGCCGGGYDEGALIVCAAISAMSALAWPGRGIDKKRFIEILTKAEINPSPLKISIPLLCQEDSCLKNVLLASNKSFYLTTEIDKDYSELITFLMQKDIVINDAQRKTIKQNSYGFLLYNQIRCGFVHEYKIGENATTFDQMRNISNVNANNVSYTVINDSPQRRIHFPISWISHLSRIVAHWLDEQRAEKGKQIFETIDLPFPDKWWIS